jgi:hypothetical protein
MATSGTYAFNPDVGDIVEEAFERAGTELRTGNDLRSARRSINYLMLEWQNEGINLWTLDQSTLGLLTEGTATYDVDMDTISILDGFLRTNSGSVTLQSDLTMTRMSEPTYSQIPSKLTQGRPVQYFYNRIGIQSGASGGADVPSTLTFWPVPEESSKYEFIFWRMRRIYDVGSSAGNTMDVPDRFLPALVDGLALQTAIKKPELAGRVNMLQSIYSKSFGKAAEEDREKANLMILPDMSGYR